MGGGRSARHYTATIIQGRGGRFGSWRGGIPPRESLLALFDFSKCVFSAFLVRFWSFVSASVWALGALLVAF